MKRLLWISMILTVLSACQNETKKDATKSESKSQETAKPSFDKKAYKLKGMAIAKTTFKAFKTKIEAVAATEGLSGVVGFCQKNALKLTDSMGKANNVIIKRTSNKLRNPDNKPDIDEQAVLNEYLKLQKEHKPMTPVVMKDAKGFVHFYAPIKLKNACLKCHGTPGQEMPEKIAQLIKEKYPNDQAIGYKAGELRGIWDIKFLNQK